MSINFDAHTSLSGGPNVSLWLLRGDATMVVASPHCQIQLKVIWRLSRIDMTFDLRCLNTTRNRPSWFSFIALLITYVTWFAVGRRLSRPGHHKVMPGLPVTCFGTTGSTMLFGDGPEHCRSLAAHRRADTFPSLSLFPDFLSLFLSCPFIRIGLYCSHPPINLITNFAILMHNGVKPAGIYVRHSL